MYKWTKSNTYAQRLSGRDGEKIGLTRSISVMPGDKVNIEVYAKYYDPTASNEATFANLMNAIISGINVPAGTFVDCVGYGQASSLPFTPGWGAKDGTGAPPMAYLNWMVFDRDYSQDLGRSGYMRITTNAKETGTNATHDKLFSPEITITQPGYVYIWLSNENPTPVEVYFDDFKVTQVKSPVIQQDDYYAFGLTFNSYSRENSVLNQYKYNGMEEQDELNLGWLDYGARMYMSDIGRWGVIDLLCEMAARTSPYAYAYNNPMRFTDPTGMMNEDEVYRTGGFNSNGQYEVNIYYSSDSYGAISDNINEVGSCCNGGKGDKVDAKQDATQGDKSVNAPLVKYQLEQERKAGIARLKKLLEAAKTIDLSDLAYKMSNSKNPELGKALSGAGKIKSGIEILVKLEEKDALGFAVELVKLGISLTKYADGYAVLELGATAIEILGISAAPEYASDLLNASHQDFMEAMKFRESDPLRREYLDRAIKKEKEAYRVINNLITK